MIYHCNKNSDIGQGTFIKGNALRRKPRHYGAGDALEERSRITIWPISTRA